MTQEKLADTAGIDASFLGRIERGQSKNLQINTLEKIIHALDVDYPTFFSFDSTEDRKVSLISKLSLVDNQNELLDIFERIINISLQEKG